MAAGPEVTANPLTSTTVSLPPSETTETFREPVVAVGCTVMLAVMEVLLVALIELTVMPAPKLTVLVDEKCV